MRPDRYIEALLAETVPPDDDLADLIEWAFLDEQIDGETQSLRLPGWKATMSPFISSLRSQ